MEKMEDQFFIYSLFTTKNKIYLMYMWKLDKFNVFKFEIKTPIYIHVNFNYIIPAMKFIWLQNFLQ
jgi:hypothetical protein